MARFKRQHTDRAKTHYGKWKNLFLHSPCSVCSIVVQMHLATSKRIVWTGKTNDNNTKHTQRRGKSATFIRLVWDGTHSVQHCRVWMDWALSDDDIKQYQHFIFVANRSSLQKVQRFSSFYIITFVDDDDFVCLLSIYYSYSSFSFHVAFFLCRFFYSFIFTIYCFCFVIPSVRPAPVFLSVLCAFPLVIFIFVCFWCSHFYYMAWFSCWDSSKWLIACWCILYFYTIFHDVVYFVSFFTLHTLHFALNKTCGNFRSVVPLLCSMCWEIAASSAGLISDNCGVQCVDRCFIALRTNRMKQTSQPHIWPQTSTNHVC